MPTGSEHVINRLAGAGIDMEEVARVLETEGVASFAKSFDELMQSLSDKANALTGGVAGPARPARRPAG